VNLNASQRAELLRKARNGTLAANDQHWQAVCEGARVGNRDYTNLYDEIMSLGGPNAGQSAFKFI
jgi:hypothetical protein